MYCSICGTRNQAGSRSCTGCGEALRPGGSIVAADEQRLTATAEVAACPRCGYRGQGMPYFSRGRHVVALIAATAVTAGMVGAGGIAYYLLRRDHLICPRCGHGWGRDGEAAIALQRDRAAAGRHPVPRPAMEGSKRGWSVFFFLVAGVMIAAGLAAGEAAAVILGLLPAAAGALLHRSANRAREIRRAELVTSLQLPVLQLAAERRGRLTVTQVAAELGWPIRRAERILQSLDDGLRVDSRVTDDGVIVYEFRELLPPAGGSGERSASGE